MERATIYSIAKALGVHASTVSRALNRPDMVRPEVRDAVLAKAKEIGYVTNAAARSLITGKTGVLGLMVPDIENPFFPPLVRAIQDAARHVGLNVLLLDSRLDPVNEPDLIAQVRAHVEGLVLAAPRAELDELISAAAGLPLVLINRIHPGVPSVNVDNSAALEEAASKFLTDGHERILLLRGPRMSWASSQRARVLRAWAQHVGATLAEIGPIEAVFDGGVEAATEIAATGATAVFAFDDVMACGVITGLLQLGLSVPGDVSVIGCDDVLLARTMYPGLTTIRAPFEALGATAVSLVRSGEDSEGKLSTALPGELVFRASTGQAPASSARQSGLSSA